MKIRIKTDIWGDKERLTGKIFWILGFDSILSFSMWAFAESNWFFTAYIWVKNIAWLAIIASAEKKSRELAKEKVEHGAGEI